MKSIKHGQLTDEYWVKMMVEMGAVWGAQRIVEELADSANFSAQRVAKVRTAWDGTDTAYKPAIKHGLPTDFGTDVMFDASASERQGRLLAFEKR